jgi:large subunit ribosomal protein L24e
VSNCTFCGAAIEQGTGKMYIKKDGTVLYFESSKCQRNMVELGRVNRHVGWTAAAKAAKSPVAKAPKAAAPKKAAK